MHNGQGGYEAGGEVPAELLALIKSEGFSFSVQRGTEKVTVCIKGAPDNKRPLPPSITPVRKSWGYTYNFLSHARSLAPGIGVTFID